MEYLNLMLSKMCLLDVYNTLEGIAILHLLPDKVPARCWTPTLVTDGRTLVVVNVDFSIPVPLTIVLKT